MRLTRGATLLRIGLLAAMFMAAAGVPARAGRGMDNCIYIEYGGNAGLYSINYDRILLAIAEKRHLVGLRLGVSWLPLNSAGESAFFSAPFTVVYLAGRGEHKLEIDAGITGRAIAAGGHARGVANFSPAAGYRFQQVSSDFNFRIMFTPLFFGKFKPWFGLSLGRSF